MNTEDFLLPKYRHLKKEYDAATQCNRCGFCETSCPTYVVTGMEIFSPRGRNQAYRQILEGKIKDPNAAMEIFSTCLTCHACTNVCFSQVPVGTLMAHAREISEQNNLSRFFLNLAQRFLFSHRRILSVFLWTGFLMKRLGVASLMNKIGILKSVSPELAAANELIAKPPLAFGASQGRKGGKNAGGIKTAYFSGCGIHYLYPRAAKACVNILRALSSKVDCPSHACCGLTLHSAGDVEGSKKLAKKVIRQFAETGADAIAVDDDSCCGFLKNYAKLLDGDPEAKLFAAKVMNTSEFLLKNKGERVLGARTGEKKTRVTFHDPCQMGNGHHAFGPPREVLKNWPGADFVELEEANWCCGGAGTYCLKHPDMADDVLDRKLDNIQKSGAALVLSEASSCLMHIEYGLRKKGWEGQIKIQHIAEYLEKNWPKPK